VPLHVELVDRGYFPKEVPPIFTTASLAAAVAAGRVTVTRRKNSWARLQEYSLARTGGLRRQLGVPQPEHFIGLAQALDAAWATDLEPLLMRNQFGVSPLLPAAGPRVFQVPTEELISRRTALRLGARYVVKTDIQNFYASIYTHAIPWAIYGKAASKSALTRSTGKTTTSHGDIIDKWLRSGQDGQTLGVPVGPDTSLMIAELLMVAVEQEVEARLPGVRAFRYYDDFEFACADLAQAEAVVHVAEQALHQLELSLNSRKTSVIRLPDVIDSVGIAELRRAEFGTGRRQRSDVTSYFDKVAHFIASDTETPIGAFGLARLRNIDFSPDSWLLVQTRAASMAVADTSLLAQYASMLAHFTELGLEVDPSLVKVGS
jgi:hypothetical protein